MIAAVEQLKEAREEMKKQMGGIGEPGVYIDPKEIIAYENEKGETKTLIRMDALIGIVRGVLTP